MADRTNDERLREITEGTYIGLDEGAQIAAELLAARAEVAEARRLDGVRLSQIVSLQEIIRNDTTPAGVEVARFRVEVERLRDEAANWRNLLPVYEDAEREVQQLRADLREALELLRELGRPDHGDDLDARYVAFLEKHKETP